MALDAYELGLIDCLKRHDCVTDPECEKCSQHFICLRESGNVGNYAEELDRRDRERR